MCAINSMAKKAGKVRVIMQIIQLGMREYMAPIK